MVGEDDLVVADRIAQELGQLTRMVTSCAATGVTSPSPTSSSSWRSRDHCG
jgi:hypothetical protein